MRHGLEQQCYVLTGFFIPGSHMCCQCSLASVTFLYGSVCSRSSKNRRKTERKKRSLKEGSVYEDVALVEALGELVCTADRMQGTVWGRGMATWRH